MVNMVTNMTDLMTDLKLSCVAYSAGFLKMRDPQVTMAFNMFQHYKRYQKVIHDFEKLLMPWMVAPSPLAPLGALTTARE